MPLVILCYSGHIWIECNIFLPQSNTISLCQCIKIYFWFFLFFIWCLRSPCTCSNIPLLLTQLIHHKAGMFEEKRTRTRVMQWMRSLNGWQSLVCKSFLETLIQSTRPVSSLQPITVCSLTQRRLSLASSGKPHQDCGYRGFNSLFIRHATSHPSSCTPTDVCFKGHGIKWRSLFLSV